MKKVKEILGEHYTDEVEKAINQYVGQGFVSKVDFNKKNEELKELREKQAQVPEVKNEKENLSKQLEETKAEYEKRIQEMQNKFNENKLDGILKSAKVRNTKALKALLDRETIEFGEDGISGLEEQLNEIRKSDSYLFESETDGAARGSNFPAGETGPDKESMPVRKAVI